ncbi:MAG: hypothetical protein KAW40_03235, partial [Candidatus Aenigmarchaeota archaeon]|nr:hypothetical protein [Candidatus Aenigmarchaeota archaeon]
AINRSDSQPDNEVNLSYQLWDTIVDNYTTFPDNTTEVFTWIFNKTNWVELQELVNSTHYYYNFNPTCSLEVGKTYWEVNVSGDECYNDTESELFPIEVIGDLNNTVLYPLGYVQYDQGDPVPMNGTVVDDCWRNVSNVKVRFRMNATPATFYYCPDPGYVTNTTGNYYNCTWDTSSIPAGHYNVTMISWNDSYNNDTKMAIADLFLTAPVSLENASVSPDPGGWGDTFNFTITVTHYTNVTVCLLEKTGINYFVTECKNTTGAPDNQVMEFNNTYDCSKAETNRFYKFNASETVGGFAYAEEPNASEIYFYIDKDNLTFVHVYGNGTNVTRNGNDYAKFVLYANDTTSGKPAEWIPSENSPNISFNVTQSTWSAGDYLFDGWNKTNSSGHVVYYFNATCTHNASRQYWRASVGDDDECYNSGISNPYNVTVLGTLYPNVTWPNGTEYEESVTPSENVVNISGDIMDECNFSVYIPGANVNFTINSSAGGGEFYCTSGIDDLGNGTYNCSWDFNGKPYGWYDVIMNASDIQYYVNGSRTKYNTFRILPHTFSPPDLNNETFIYEQDGGWGENFTFMVNVSDVDAQNVNITFYLSDDNSTWKGIENKTCDNCLLPRWINFYYADFGPDNITGSGQYVYFKFNATDANNITSRPGFNFTIDKDDVSVLYGGFGNFSDVNRSETILFRLLINDTDNSSLVLDGTNGSIWIAFNDSNFDEGHSNTTLSGNLSYYFIPNCSYSVGPQLWYGGTDNDSYYKDNVSINYTLIVYGWLNNSVLEPNGTEEAYYYSNQNVTVEANIQDYLSNVNASCGFNVTDANITIRVSHYDSRLTPSEYNDTCSPVYNWSIGIYNCTWNVSNNPSGWYNVTIESNRTYYNPYTFVKKSFFHEVSPILSGEYTDKLSVIWGSNVSRSQITFFVNVTDDDDNVTVLLWEMGPQDSEWTLVDTKYCFDCINTTVNFTRLYDECSEASWGDQIGEWDWKINVSDKYNFTHNTSIGNFNVTRRDLLFNEINGSDSWVNRTFNNNTLFRLEAIDNYTGSSVSLANLYYDTGYFYVTNATGWRLIGSDPLAGNGVFDILFDPDCTGGIPDFEVGPHDWRGEIFNEFCYYDSYSDNYTATVTSILNNTLTYPLNDVKYIKVEEPVTFYGDVHDFDPSCGYITGVTVEFNVTGSNDYLCDSTNDYNNGTYNCTWTHGVGASLGLHNTTMISSKSYFDPDSDFYENTFRLVERPRLVNVSVDSETDGWGHEFNFTVMFRDEEGGNEDNITLWKSYDGTNFTEVSTQTRTNNISWTLLEFLVNFTCDDMLQQSPVIYYKFNATNQWSKTNETSVYNITLTKDNLSVSTPGGSGWTIDRVGTANRTLRVFVQDVNKGLPASNPSANGSFYITTDSSTYWLVNTTTTNASSYLNHPFDPDCNYSADDQFWYAELGDQCYYENETNQSAYDDTFLVKGQLINYLNTPTKGSNYNVSDPVPVNFTVLGDCDENVSDSRIYS